MISTLLFLLATVTLGDSPQESDAQGLAAVLAEERARIQLIKKISPAVVCLFPKDTMAGGGSGVLIDADGIGVTNFHVVAPTLATRQASGGLSDHKKYDVEVLGIDPHGDLAMFRLVKSGATPHVEIGDSDALAVGDQCLALGNPFLLADDFTPTVTFGIISGLHRYQWGTGHALNYTDCIQVDTSINPGNSGGPLFDMNGKLIGINGRVSIEERGRVNVGVGYAITTSQIQRFIPALRAGLVTPHAASGFTVIDAGGGCIVNQILEDSAAYRAGLRLNDRVQRFGGVDVRSANHFASLLGTYPAGWPVEIVFRHDQSILKSVVRMDALPLPAPRKSPHGRKTFDPFAPTSETRAANRRAVRRAIDLYAKS
ncbi:MAG TPA: trypsin-like peptidase domain-containing protein, partial [Phycisphaerae bacterium]|nr:trypsin-like peptidase domain-containing protein [Phycisphaerae bacterium]